MLPLNQIILGDCLEVMRELPDNSVDLILTDPPFFKVKNEAWDRQWADSAEFLRWVERLCVEWRRLLKPNGSLYCFASPRMSARVEVKIGEYFNVLTNIRWRKSGRSQAVRKESLRAYFPDSESIIFAEHFGSDSFAKGCAGYGEKCDELRRFVFEPIRSYLAEEKHRAGVSGGQIQEWFASHGYPKYAAARHSFAQSQWEMPTAENYDCLRRCFNELAAGKFLRREYEYLRRPFYLSRSVPFTDIWDFKPVAAYAGKHVCEKPNAMLEHMISVSSKSESVVLDCFAGSSSTLIAAKKLGRNYIGIEIDEHWVKIARSRLRSGTSQG